MASASQSGAYYAVRTGSWWTQVVPVIIGLGAFSVYATYRAVEGAYFYAAPHLSPFYWSLIDPWPLSPALLILGGPLGFRATCYYYRKAYYRAFFFDPPACAVSERKHNYGGETRFPFILQNVHRYFMYLAIVFLVFLWHDAVCGFLFADGFGIGVGTLVLLVNVCPEEIHITDNAIIPLKERVVDEFYDPVLQLVRKIRGVNNTARK